MLLSCLTLTLSHFRVSFAVSLGLLMQAGNASAPTKLPRAAALLMAASNKQYHWPTGYVKGSSQAIRDIANRLLSILRADPAQYAGFRSTTAAQHVDNQFFWALAQISYDLVPHAAQFKARGYGIPAVFLQCAEGSVPAVAKKQLSQEMLQVYCDKLERICGKSDVLPARFKLWWCNRQLWWNRHQ